MVQSRAVSTGHPTAKRAVAALGVVGLALWGCGRSEQSLTSPCTSIAAELQPLLDSALAVHRRHTELMAIPGFVGTGVGLTADCRPAITIFTRQAGVAGLPDALEGIPVEVQVTGEIVAQSR